MSTLNEGPEALAEIRKKRRPTEPMFTGFTFVWCACGARGNVNKALLKRGQRKVERCVNCRDR